MVWLPPVVAALSKLTMPPLAILTAPLSVAPLMKRSREFVIVVASSAPVKFTPSRMLLPLLMAWNEPVPLTLITPFSVTPFCTTTLPAPATIWLPVFDTILVDSSSVPPLTACSVPLLTKLLPPPLPGATMFSVPPDTSAETRPLSVSRLSPPKLMAKPKLPWPRTVMPAPSVVLPVPSTASRAPASFRLMVPVPRMVWLPPVVLALSKLRMPPLPMFTAPLSVAPLTMRSRELAMAVMSMAPPLSFTPSRKLLPLLAAAKLPLPAVLIKPPLIVTPLCTTVLAFAALIWPAALLTFVASTSVPPLRASSSPLLVTLPAPAGGVIVNVPPFTSAEMRPLLTSRLVPPAISAVPMLPCPRTTMPAPSVVVPLPSSARRAPASFRLKLPLPPMLLAAPSVASKLTMPPLAMFTAPFSVMPLPMRSREFAMVAASTRPLKVTPLRRLLPLLNATSAPVPAVLTVPPVMAPVNWFSTLPLAMLMKPPLLSIEFDICNAAVLPLPTLIVPVLVVLPPPCSANVNASMSIVPALNSVKIDCAVLTVTVLPRPMVALSFAGPVGTAPHDHPPGEPQLPVAGFQVQLAARASWVGATPTTSMAAMANADFLNGLRGVVM